MVEGSCTALPLRPEPLRGARRCTFYQKRLRRLNSNSDVVVFTHSVNSSQFSKPEKNPFQFAASIATTILTTDGNFDVHTPPGLNMAALSVSFLLRITL